MQVIIIPQTTSLIKRKYLEITKEIQGIQNGTMMKNSKSALHYLDVCLHIVTI